MSTFTINKTTGEFVVGRRSARLAAKRGVTVVGFTPRVERFSAGAEVAAPVAPATATGRRTSARLAPLYAKKAAVEKARAEALALVDEVLAYADERAGQLGIGDYSDVRMKGAKGYKIYYDPVTDIADCDCATMVHAELQRMAAELLEVLRPLTAAANSGDAKGVAAYIIATYDYPHLGLLLLGRRVLPALARFSAMLEAKAREFAVHPRATPTLRLVCAEILSKFFS